MLELNKIQKELKAPKNQRNNFWNYNYRSCEDIMEAIKPLLWDAILTVSDEVVEVWNRIYVKATATISTWNTKESTTAFAREPETQKGMNEAQITWSASSYARKYALNWLFAIDDTKDADATNNHWNDDWKKEYNNDKRGLMHVINDMKSATTVEDRVKLKEEWKTFAKSEKQVKWLTDEWNKLT